MFDVFRVEKLEPGSAMFLDFFEDETGNQLVKVVYKRDAATEEAILVDGKDILTLDEFISFLSKKI